MMKKMFSIVATLLLGLAAEAEPVKSMIGAKCANDIESGSESEAILYIQDGLVCLWDGIETGGYGVTQFGKQGFTWVNCVNGESVENSSLVFTSEDGVGVSSTYAFKGFPISEIFGVTEWTIEYVATLVPGDYQSFLRGQESQPFVFYPQSCGVSQTDYRACIRGGGYGYSLYADATPQSLLGCSFARGSSFHKGYLYVDEEDFVMRNINMSITEFPQSKIAFADYSAGMSRIKCIRIYNRALSEEEIGYNHSIDKMRFE